MKVRDYVCIHSGLLGHCQLPCNTVRQSVQYIFYPYPTPHILILWIGKNVDFSKLLLQCWVIATWHASLRSEILGAWCQPYNGMETHLLGDIANFLSEKEWVRMPLGQYSYQDPAHDDKKLVLWVANRPGNHSYSYANPSTVPQHVGPAAPYTQGGVRVSNSL